MLGDLKPPDGVARVYSEGGNHRRLAWADRVSCASGAFSLCSETITHSTLILRISKRRLNCNATELDKAFFSKGGYWPTVSGTEPVDNFEDDGGGLFE